MATKETGIIMSGDHPKLILDELKTMTRRVIKPQPPKPLIYRTVKGKPDLEYWYWADEENETIHPIKCPYGQVGDRLWVRETFCQVCYRNDKIEDVCYKEDLERFHFGSVGCDMYKATPSLFMPHWASRITLEITDIRAERLPEITPEDIEAEGITIYGKFHSLLWNWIDLWNSLNAKQGFGWSNNPWVWVISFKVIK